MELKHQTVLLRRGKSLEHDRICFQIFDEGVTAFTDDIGVAPFAILKVNTRWYFP